MATLPHPLATAATVAPARPRIGVADPLPGVVYPPEALLARYLAAGALTRETLAQGLRQAFAHHAERPALCLPEGVVRYAELDQASDCLAAALLDLGLRPTERVLFQLGNSQELVLGWLACLKAGLIPVCTLAAHREVEMAYLGRHSGARMHFVAGDDPKFDDVAFAQALRAKVPSLRWTLQARGPARSGSLSLHGLIAAMAERPAGEVAAALARVPQDPFQVAMFQLSGGTTGVPKIIPRFNNEYLYNMRRVAEVNGYRADDCLFMPLPMMHNLSMGCCVGPFLLSGGSYAIAPQLTPEVLEALFQRYQPTWAVMGGPILEKLRPAIEAGRLPLARLRGAMAPNNSAKISRLLGAPVFHIFGMTEGVIMTTRAGDPAEVREQMIGRPVSPLDQVKLLHPGTEEEILTPDTEGECVFAGPYTIHGYYDAEERNRETFTSDGFYRSGDLMAFRDMGGQRYYRFCGRTKDVVDRAGEKINSEEIELLVARHPAVALASVVGMPDPVYRERVCVFVILREGHAPLTVAALGAFLEQQGLAKFKWPERVEVITEVPVTGSGKLSKPLLRAAIARTLDAERAARTADTTAHTAADALAGTNTTPSRKETP